jgi:hypothetical protein
MMTRLRMQLKGELPHSRTHLFSTDKMAVQAFFSLWASRDSVLNRASVRSSS